MNRPQCNAYGNSVVISRAQLDAYNNHDMLDPRAKTQVVVMYELFSMLLCIDRMSQTPALTVSTHDKSSMVYCHELAH